MFYPQFRQVSDASSSGINDVIGVSSASIPSESMAPTVDVKNVPLLTVADVQKAYRSTPLNVSPDVPENPVVYEKLDKQAAI